MTAHGSRSDSASESGMSRRGMVKAAAQIGAAGLATGVVLGGVTGTAAAAAPDRADTAPTADHGPVVVQVRDARTGELEVFHGQEHHRVHDPALAAAIMRVVR